MNNEQIKIDRDPHSAPHSSYGMGQHKWPVYQTTDQPRFLIHTTHFKLSKVPKFWYHNPSHQIKHTVCLTTPLDTTIKRDNVDTSTSHLWFAQSLRSGCYSLLGAGSNKTGQIVKCWSFETNSPLHQRQHCHLFSGHLNIIAATIVAAIILCMKDFHASSMPSSAPTGTLQTKNL